MDEGRRVCVVFAGGGTGGHLFPALAIAEALLALRPDVEPFFVGAERGIEARVLPARSLPHLLVDVSGLQRGGLGGNLSPLVRMVGAVRRVSREFRERHPALVVVTGGYAAAPAGVAALLRRIPLVVQEQNSLPGVTTRLLARWATQIHIAFPEARGRLTPGRNTRVFDAGNPIRIPGAVDRVSARRQLALPSDHTVVLVAGGSQGSRALNERVLAAVRGVSEGVLSRPEAFTLIWSTGPGHFEALAAALTSLGSPDWVRTVGFIEDMPLTLAAVDVAVSRSGAMTISEYLAWGIPAVLIPLPSAAEDHQSRNAEALQEAGVAIHLPEAEATPERLWGTILDLARDGERCRAMAQRARARARPGAAADIAGAIARLLPPPQTQPPK